MIDSDRLFIKRKCSHFDQDTVTATVSWLFVMLRFGRTSNQRGRALSHRKLESAAGLILGVGSSHGWLIGVRLWPGRDLVDGTEINKMIIEISSKLPRGIPQMADALEGNLAYTGVGGRGETAFLSRFFFGEGYSL